MNRTTGTALASLVPISMMLLPVSPVEAVELFGPSPVVYPTANATVLAVGDFDSDGIPDLVIGELADGSSRVSVFLGDGLGSLSRGTAVALGPDSALGGVVADFDGDGSLDLAVLTAARLVVMSGNGLGGFSREVDASVTGGTCIASGDFNRDAIPDLVVADPARVTILLGDGLGEFTTTTLQGVQVGDDPRSIAVGDLDGDGADDLVIGNLGYLDVLLGDGFGGFFEAPDARFANTLQSLDLGSALVLGDFNSDGMLDVVVASDWVEIETNMVRVLFGTGQGGFSGPLSLDGKDNVVAPSTASEDFNGDGLLDVAVLSVAGVSVYAGDGRGNFSARDFPIEGTLPVSLGMGDFNGDGAPEFAVALHVVDLRPLGLTVLLADGLGGFTRALNVPARAVPASLAVGDLDGDEFEDLVIADEGFGFSTVLLADGLGGFVPVDDSRRLDTGPVESVGVGDYNADGNLDLAFAGRGIVRFFTGDGHAGFSRAAESLFGGQGQKLVIGDFNGDGASDLAVTSGWLGDSLSIFAGARQGGFPRTDISLGYPPSFVAVGDFNEDAHLDLVVSSVSGLHSSVLLGDGSGAFTVRTDDTGFGGPLAVGDFNGDGAPDLAVAETEPYPSLDSTVSILLGDHLGGFSRTGLPQAGGGTRSLIAGDFNADGYLDLAVTDVTRERLLLGDGHGGLFPLGQYLGGSLLISSATGDFNRDGAPDLVVGDWQTNEVKILFNQLESRADTNGSNRIDGFDVAAIGRLAGSQRCAEADPGCRSTYRGNADVNFDGITDGDDLALVAHRFGRLRKSASPLRATLDPAAPPTSKSATLQQTASEGDLLTVQVLVSNNDEPAAAAAFAVTFDPNDGTRGQVFEVAGSAPGTYFSGTGSQLSTVDTKTPGRADVTVSRFPPEDRITADPQPVISLFLRARRSGQATLDFAPYNEHSEPVLLTASGREVAGVTFQGGGTVTVTASGNATPGQRLGTGPSPLDFGEVPPGGSSRRSLRISNFGFSDLEVTGVTSELPELTTFLSSAFEVPPFGFVELPVVFSAARDGVFSGDLLIASDDPTNSELRAPILGRSGSGLAVVPSRMDFGRVAVGSSRSLRVRITNRGTASVILTSFHSSDARFAPQLEFVTLDPGQSGDVTVRFLPSAAGVAHGALTLGFDAPGGETVIVSLKGAGT